MPVNFPLKIVRSLLNVSENGPVAMVLLALDTGLKKSYPKMRMASRLVRSHSQRGDRLHR